MDETNSNVMIEVDRLTKRYGVHKAVDDISFSCREGEIVGFLGPNGAGKTTTMRILTGYMPPTSGDAYIAGCHTLDDSLAARRQLGYLPETVPLYPEMTVEDYLAFVGNVRRLDNLWDCVDAVLEDVDLLDRAESSIGSLSKGMRQRVGLAQALLHDPDVLILDEPTIGLDPAQIVEIRQIIADLGRRRTVLLSTHILAEVEQICTRVIMIINGRLWADIPMQEIQHSGHLLTLHLAQPAPNTAQQLAQLDGVQEVTEQAPHIFQLAVDGRDETRITAAETAVRQGWGLLELSPQKISLETLFLNKLQEAETANIAPEETSLEQENKLE